MRIEVVDKFEEFLKLESVWNVLLYQTDADFPFLTFEWLSCWWKSFGNAGKLLILLVQDEQETIGLAPLMFTSLRMRGILLKAVTFIANYHSNRTAFILKNKHEEIISAIFEFLKSNYKFDLIYLEMIEENTNTVNALNKVLDKEKYKFVVKSSCNSPYIVIKQGWDDYYKERLKKLRDDIRYGTNLLKKNHKFEFKKFIGNDQKVFSDILKVSQNTWQFKNNTAIASHACTVQFYRDLAEVCARKEWLNLYMLKINNEPAAFEFILNYKKKAYLLKTGFNERFRRFSPGILLLANSIKDSFNYCLKEYDLLGESDSYKMRWATAYRAHRKYLIFNHNLIGTILFFLESKVVPPINKIKECMRFKDKINGI